MSDIKDYVDQLAKNLEGLWSIYLFGSVAQKTDGPMSDLDFAVLGEPQQKYAAETLWELGQSLAVKLDQDVDLLDLRQSTTIMQAQVVHTGQRIYCADPVQSDFFEAFVLGRYVRFQEERKAIVEQFLKGKNPNDR